jgi:hypothetical protein
MASEILGLFTTPDQYQAQQQDIARARAMEYAKLSPFEQANTAIGQGAYNLAGAIGGALGGQDPQLQKITQRQQLLGMIDPANPDSYAQAIQAALQTGDQEAAFLLRNEMVKVKQQAQEEQLNQMKVQDYLTQRGQGMQAAGLTNMANELVGQLKNPDGTINEDVKAKLLSFPQGRAAISEQAKVLPDLRQLGASGTPEVNPFDLFVNDPTVPAPLKTTAKQYQSSFAKGIYSPEQADKLVERLATATQKATEFQQTQSRLEQNQQMLDSYRQQGLANSQASLNLQRQQAELNADLKRQDAERKAEIAKNKPLPANLAKSEEDDYDIATSATNLATDANAYINRIKSGEIKFGLKDKASIATRGAFGSEDPDVIARQDFDKFIERMTSENLRLNKGVQTDKDFERELRLLKSAESAASAAQIMQNLVKINVRKVQDAKASIERRRVNAGLGMPVVPIAIPQFGERPPLSNFETTNTNPMGTTGGRR